MELAQFTGPYSSFEGSPLSQGKFQFDLWEVKPSHRYDWETLRQQIKIHGVKNSLCLAPMPTASTSQILGNNECFEPFTSNLYTRRTLAGEFMVINKFLMKELIDKGIWNMKIKDKIIEYKGSVQKIEEIPEDIRRKYKIVWEIPMKHIIDRAKERGAFICQSQSMNLWIEDPNYKILTAIHLYSWKAGLKTGMYYLRRKAKHQAQQFTVVPENKSSEPECLMCSG
jgi:ribonucleotide reductase alpha subunit